MRSDGNLGGGLPAAAAGHDNWLRRRLAFVPHPLRFIAVGGALIVGAAISAGVSYAGHALIAFAPVSKAIKTESRA